MYMWRLTHDPKYREWGWEAVEVRRTDAAAVLPIPTPSSPKRPWAEAIRNDSFSA